MPPLGNGYSSTLWAPKEAGGAATQRRSVARRTASARRGRCIVFVRRLYARASYGCGIVPASFSTSIQQGIEVCIVNPTAS